MLPKMNELDPVWIILLLLFVGLWLELSGHGDSMRRDMTNALFILMQIKPKA